MGENSNDQAFLNALFREQYGKITSALLHKFGADQLDLVESGIQEAFVKAIQLWPIKGTPSQPINWLIRTAHNGIIDQMRHRRGDIQFFEDIDGGEYEVVPARFVGEVDDDDLRMLFLCCHPALPVEGQVALLLKTACGFGVPEIARAFLVKDETIAQRLVRAKQKIRSAGLEFELPGTSEIGERLGSVTLGLYLLFNEGYSSSGGDSLVREELCDEAITLVKRLAAHPLGRTSTTHAVTALFLLHRARITTRTDIDGNILLLKDQDRTVWDKRLLREGAIFFSLSMQGDQISKFHLEAGIAACHAFAPSWEETDWNQIISHYEQLEILAPSPVVTLNKIAAILMLKGAADALVELDANVKTYEGLSYYMYPALAAEIHLQLGKGEMARGLYQEALKLVRTTAERNFLQKKLQELA